MFDWNKLTVFLRETAVYGSPSMQAAAKDILAELPEAVTVYSQCGEDTEIARLCDKDPYYEDYIKGNLIRNMTYELTKNGAVKFMTSEDKPTQRILHYAEMQVLVPKDVAETLKEECGQ